jgi:hypothetical protein
MGERAGLGVLRMGDLVDPEEAAFVTSPCCGMIDGVSLHANVSVPTRDRRRLENLCRYIARPPVSTERLSKLTDGRLLYRLKRKWRDGTTTSCSSRSSSSRNSPQSCRLLDSYGEVPRRARDCSHISRGWTPSAVLMRRVFTVDVLECPKCGGKMKILATIHPPEATTAILESLALSPRAPPMAPAPPRYSAGEESY